MTEYYYSKNPHVRHQIRHWTFRLLDHQFKFVTDNGVFSKSTVDYGSRVIINNVRTDDFPAGELLDLGCGYGPIGLALAKRMPNRQVVMSDVNNLALKLCRRNAELNHVSNVKIINSNIYDQIDQQFAGIVTNPPIRAGKKTVMEILLGARQHLISGGVLTTVIRKKQGEPSARRALEKTYGNCRILKRDKGYYVLESLKNK